VRPQAPPKQAKLLPQIRLLEENLATVEKQMSDEYKANGFVSAKTAAEYEQIQLRLRNLTGEDE
jgi:hypothetical protein